MTIRDTRNEGRGTSDELRILVHQFYEFFEQVIRVMGAGGGFGVVLDGEGRLVFTAESFVRVVVEVGVRKLDLVFFERIHIYAEAVVLAGDFDLSSLEILNGVVGSSVAEFELVCLGAESKGENLVAEAYAKDGDFAEQLADGLNGVFNGCRVAGAVA